ncbi:hypothetical protein DVH24_011847 [Malus domestica]|uniref:Serine aminopeptidase S33 domain-containing protein n=1 Tax=Malus domestica TaxID=3750 RepID=A0A498K1D8_MALDO|nr:hypothetical protein DVH24_011847 [Malus domestica]
MIHQFINFVIRPPRAEYNPDQYLWEKDFTLAGRAYKRQDLEASMGTSYRLSEHSSFRLAAIGCRADANEAAVMLLPSNITVFTLDFSGSGLSDGDYVSLGWHERDDLKIVVSYLRSKKQNLRIGLWGRSMGAVTCLLYGAEDPSIAGMVLDSAFSSLYVLMMELVDDTKSYFAPYRPIRKSRVLLTWLVALAKINTCDKVQRGRPYFSLLPRWSVLWLVHSMAKLWDRVQFLSALWASVALEFRGISL